MTASEIKAMACVTVRFAAGDGAQHKGAVISRIPCDLPFADDKIHFAG
jgi:hypothetical protein